jgi:hypothetical protein
MRDGRSDRLRATQTVVIPRACGGSSTPRLIDSIIGISGIPGRPPSRAMTAEIILAARNARSFFNQPCPPNQRAQGRPDARCTRGLMCDVQQRMLHMSIQVQRRTPGLPCAMALRLIRVRPGDRLSCHHHRQRLSPRHDLTPAPGRQAHTISPYASAALVSRSFASTAPCPSFATMANAPLTGQDAGFLRCFYLTVEAEYF